MLTELRDVALTITAVFGALAGVGTAAWWLLGPRVRAFLATLQQVTDHASAELRVDVPGSTAAHAAQAASAAEQLPAMRRQLDDLVTRQEQLDQARVVERLDLVELLAQNNQHRVGRVEQAIVSWLGGSALIRPERPDPPNPHRPE